MGPVDRRLRKALHHAPGASENGFIPPPAREQQVSARHGDMRYDDRGTAGQSTLPGGGARQTIRPGGGRKCTSGQTIRSGRVYDRTSG